MAVVPLLPPGGFTVLARNLREARRQGQPRNMALPGTYYWFYQQVKNRGNDSNLLIVFYVQIMPDDFVMQLHRF